MSGGPWRKQLRAAALLASVALLAGCSLLPGQGPAADPGSTGPSPSAVAATSAAPSPAASASEPSIPMGTTLPTVIVPSAEPDGKGQQVGTTRIRGRSTTASWDITVPVFSGGRAAAEATRRVRAAADGLIAQVRREEKDDAGAERMLTGEGTVVTNDDRTVQVTIMFVDFLAGTAHPSLYVTTTVVDVAEVRPVLLRQVIQNPPEGLRFLREQVVKVAKAEGDTVDPAGLAPRLELWANWQTTEEGITFSFDDGQLGGRGIRSYTVPWSSARLVLSEYGEALLAPR